MNDNSQKEIDEYGLLSAIWILACNDENPFLLYGSTRFRLGLPEFYDLESLIKKHGELFRQKCPEFRLEEWKRDMLMGNRQPIWIKSIEDNKERKALINSLKPKDVFRSQFRANANAPRSDLNIIDWGLQHIERLRKAEIETKEGKWKKLTEVWLPLASLLIALGTLLITSYWQQQNIQAQKELKEYELSFKPKQEGYSNYMEAINTGFDIARKNSTIQPPTLKNNDALINHFRQIELKYFAIEPFLDNETKKNLWDTQGQYKVFLTEINDFNARELSESQKRKK